MTWRVAPHSLFAVLAVILAVGAVGCDSDPPTRLRSCRLAESSLDFGPVYAGESATRDFLVINDGTAELNLTAVVASPDFHLAEGDTVRFMANPGDTVRVPVVFAPTSLGSKSASFVLTGGPCHGSPLKGEGINPCLVEPETLEFGIVSLNTPQTETLTITNLGNNSLEGSVSLDCPEFTIQEGAELFSLAHGESHQVVVELTATELGTKSCTVDLGMPLCSQVECSAQAGRTWEVKLDGSGDAPTIQAAIDSASSGEVILVHPGRYYETIDYKGKALTVRSLAGPETTLLDGSQTVGTVVTMNSPVGTVPRLEGFTVTGGSATVGDQIGGGVRVMECGAMIQDNIVEGNYASRWGGGVIVSSGYDNPVVRRNWIRNNRARANGGGMGFVATGSVTDNIIENNTAERGDGGGIWAWFPDVALEVTIKKNQIVGNTAGDHGGGIYAVDNVAGASTEIAYNLIADNKAGGRAFAQLSGGGIWLYGGAHWVHHNTIVGNDARGAAGGGPGWGGGGIAIVGPGERVIETNIIAYSTYGGGIRCETDDAGTIRNNLVWENVGGSDGGACPDWLATGGNLSADPKFCDQEAGDYKLAEDSPAMLHPAGPLGAYPIAGCTEPSAPSSTWTRMRGLYR